jgi:hypothetical protein
MMLEVNNAAAVTVAPKSRNSFGGIVKTAMSAQNSNIVNNAGRIRRARRS